MSVSEDEESEGFVYVQKYNAEGKMIDTFNESLDVTCPGPESTLTYYSEYVHRVGDLHIEGIHLQKELSIKNHHSTHSNNSRGQISNKKIKYVTQFKPILYVTGLLVDVTLPPTYNEGVKVTKSSPVEAFTSGMVVNINEPLVNGVNDEDDEDMVNNMNVPTYLGRLEMTGGGDYFSQCCVNIGQGLPWPCIKT